MTVTEQQTLDALAFAAVEPIQSGMVVGLGSGRTASRGVVALAQRVKEGKLTDIRCVCTSHATESLARFHQLPVQDFVQVEQVDYLFDGADEVDAEMRMLKGAGGAIVRERIVAWAAERCVYMVNEDKIVEKLGTHRMMPIAVLYFGLASIKAHLQDIDLRGVVRRTIQGEPFLTDNGNIIIDVALSPDRDLEELAAALNDVPGIIDHGLFLREADEILIDRGDLGIEHQVRGV
jgi:ribose 5-phosphate isomerase A